MSRVDNDPTSPATLRRCLDAPTVCAWLNLHIDWPGEAAVERVHIARFHPRKGGQFDLEYELDLVSAADGSHQRVKLFGRVPRIEHDADKVSTAAQLDAAGVRNVLFNLDEVGMTVHSMDQDPELPWLATCLEAEDVMRRLQGPGTTWIDRSAAWTAAAIAYRAGRRFVVRYAPSTSGESRCGLVGKGFVDDRGLTFSARQLRLAGHLRRATGDRVRVPRVVQHIPELRMTVSEWTPTTQNGGSRWSAEAWGGCAALALAAIHSADPGDLKRIEPSRQMEAVTRWFDVIAAVRPDLVDRAHGLVAMLQSSFAGVSPSQPVVIHGDFYESQLILGRRTITVLDLDMLTVADRCIDVGNYLAHQWLWCLRSGRDTAGYAAIVRATLESYETEAQPLDDRALAFQWGASLFRVGAIHAFRCATAPHASAVWDMVAPVLRHGRRGPTSLDSEPPPGTDRGAACGASPPADTRSRA